MSEWIDREWYRSNIGDPDTGKQRRFTGTPVGNIDFELDALYFGVAFENARRQLQYELTAVFQLIDALAGNEPRPNHLALLDTTAWLSAFNILWEPSNIPSHLDPANAINFRLDVLRAMSHLPRSYRRAVTHALDGYGLYDIADYMGWMRRENVAVIDNLEAAIYDEIPNEASAERVVRNASSTIRAHCSLAIRSKPKPPQPVPTTPMLPVGDYTTDVISRIEDEIDDTRRFRRRHHRRQHPSQEAA